MDQTGGFDWDDAKAAANLAKHGVSFDEAQTVFGDPRAVTGYDASHSLVEDRFLTIGLSSRFRLLTVIHTDVGNDIRIISARDASTNERKQYVEANPT